MARFFIERPVFAIVLSIFITIGGLISFASLPISQYPPISPPTVNVSTLYTGASAQVVEESVAQAIEQNINGVENMSHMTSTSSDNGSYSLNVEFAQGTNLDIAAVQVQNLVSQANASLPSDVTNSGVTTAKMSNETILYFTLYSPNGTFDSTFLKNYGSIYIISDAKKVSGVGGISEYGADFSMKLWLNPDKMARLGVSVADVQKAVASQNVQAPAGTVGKPPFEKVPAHQYTVKVKGRLAEESEFANIIVRSDSDGSMIRIKDIGSVELTAKDISNYSDLNNKDAIMFAVQLTSDANALDTVTNVRKVIDEAAKSFPNDLEVKYIIDQTVFVKESLKEVAHTFFEALLLVLLIVFLFLQSVRATLIPIIAIPVSLIGTFGAFLALGFSINTLTLFAMVLAIGLVVDDAIVVIEAVEYNMRNYNLGPKEATVKAMDEVSGPVVAIAFVLASVFIPVAFLGGMTGILYRQFALTIAVSMGLSAVVALSLTPALCATMLKPHDAHQKKGLLDRFFDSFNNWFDRLVGRYGDGLGVITRKLRLVMAAFLVLLVLVGWTAVTLPTSFVPDEDQGYYIGSVTLPEATNLDRTRQVGRDISSLLAKIAGINDVAMITGIDILTGSNKPNSAVIFTALAPWDERKAPGLDIDSLIKKSFGATMKLPEATSIYFKTPSLPGMGNVSGFSFVIQDRSGGSLENLEQVADKLVQTAAKRPEISNVYSTFNVDTPSYNFDVDREKSEKLGVPVSDVFSALQVFLGGYQINDFNRFGKIYKVIMQAEPSFRADIEGIKFLFVRSSSGEMVPLDTLITPVKVNGPVSIKRFNGYRSAEIGGTQASGYSSGEAMAALEEVAAEVLPQGFTYAWTGQSKEEKEAGSSFNMILGLCTLFVFLCLAALYESWSIPLVVLLSVPTGLFGCFLFQLARGFENDIYMKIGLIMLIGLAAKNAILIVEYAKMRTDVGMDATRAAIEAAKLRLRPIIMTSLAFILGCVPLAIATGAGAGSRNSMGTAVIGGMVTATVLGVFLIPVLFVIIQKLSAKFFGASKIKVNESDKTV